MVSYILSSGIFKMEVGPLTHSAVEGCNTWKIIVLKMMQSHLTGSGSYKLTKVVSKCNSTCNTDMVLNHAMTYCIISCSEHKTVSYFTCILDIMLCYVIFYYMIQHRV